MIKICLPYPRLLHCFWCFLTMASPKSLYFLGFQIELGMFSKEGNGWVKNHLIIQVCFLDLNFHI